MAKHVKKSKQKMKGKASQGSGLLDRGSWSILAYCILLFTAIYVTASFYTHIGGRFGEKLSAAVLSSAGGGAVILLLFVTYSILCRLFATTVQNFIRQLSGSFLLYLTASMLLGIGAMLYPGADIPRWLVPGRFGMYIADAVTGSLGALGTLLFGLITIYMALILFNVHFSPRLLLLPFFWIAGFIARRAGGRRYAEEPQKEAPNIADYDGDDYFGGTLSELDEPPLTIIVGEERQDERLEEPSARFDEKITEFHPDVLEEGMLQDPTFNIDEEEDTDFSGMEGIFPPPIEIFGGEESREGEMDEEAALPIGEKIIKALDQFGISARLAEILVGPTVVQFRIQLAAGIKVSRVASLSNDIALALAVPSLRIEAPIPGKPYVGIEIPNPKRRGIPLRTVIASDAYENTDVALPLPFGVAVNGDSVIVGLEELPHMLVAGTTGSGKSVFVNSCIVGLCSKRTPSELRMILVDPKRVEMSVYDKLPHLLTPPVTDAKKAVHVLGWALREMESRYTAFARARVRNIEGYNEKILPKDRLPYIVIVVDELADLMMTSPKEVEEFICRLAQMARATGIHLLLATQRPSVNVVTGLIKANIPARVAFTLPSNADSRTIIDCAGAEKLLGKGDMMFLSTRYPKPVRIQAPWIAESDLNTWLDYLGNIFGPPDFMDIDLQTNGGNGNGLDGTMFDDDLLTDAIDTIMQTGIASASGLQRRLRIGFSRAGRLIDMMEQLGIVGPADGSRPREILVDEDGAAEILSSLNNSDY